MMYRKKQVLALSLLFFFIANPIAVLAANYSSPLALDELALPFTESEASGIGCIIGSLAVGSGMVYLMGGWGPVMVGLTPPLHPLRVLEGTAAISFVFSSACYLGVATAPIVMSTYTAIVDGLHAPSSPPKPLFFPNELGGSTAPNMQTSP